MPNCIKCGSAAAYWTIIDKENNTNHYCDPCFKLYDLAIHKKEMDEFHSNKRRLQHEHQSSPVPVVRGGTRYTVSSEGVIMDNTTGLEWVVGPDQSTDYNNAEAWVKGSKIAGGGWRMPRATELKNLFLSGKGQRNMDPTFKTTGWFVWTKPRDESTALGFDFYIGSEAWRRRSGDIDRNQHRVFGVRKALPLEGAPLGVPLASASPDMISVKFIRNQQRVSPLGFTGTDEIYKAPDADSAQAFLQTKIVSERYLIIIVETPVGNYCKDAKGTYKQ